MIQKLESSHFLISELYQSYRNEWQNGQGQRDKERRKYFYFSDISKCPRQVYYEFTIPEEKRTISDKTLYLFAIGNLLHDDIQQRYRSRKVAEAPRDIEFGLESDDINATGRLDMIAAEYRFIPEVDGLAVVEIKTKVSYSLESDEPEQDEIDQLLLYIDSMKKKKSIRDQKILDWGYILYLDRAGMAEEPIAAWKIDFDQARMNEILSWFKMVSDYIASGNPPDRPYERKSTHCQFCRFNHVCWADVRDAEAEARAELLEKEPAPLPAQEVVDSLVDSYIRLNSEKKKIEEQMDEIKPILLNYCRATKTEKIEAGDNSLRYETSERLGFNEERLFQKYGPTWKELASIQVTKVKAAVKNGLVDPVDYEEAKEVKIIESLRVIEKKSRKEAKNAD